MSKRITWQNWCLVGALGCYLIFLLGWLLLQPLPPLQDYVQWVYQGWIAEHLVQHAPEFVDKFRFARVPVPNELSQVLLGLACFAIGPILASKVFLVGLLLGPTGICWLAAKRICPDARSPFFVVLFCCLVSGSSFWNGYINYQLSLMLLLLYLLLQDRLNPGWVAVFSCSIFFCHASTFLAFVLLVTFTAVVSRPARRRALGLIPAMLLSLWYVIGREPTHAEQDVAVQLYRGVLAHIAYKAYTLVKIGMFQNLIDLKQQSLADRAPLLYRLGIVVNAMFAGAIAFATAVQLRRRLKDGVAAPEYAAASVLLVGFLVLPSSTLGVVNLGERLLYPALLLLIFRMKGLPWMGLLASLGLAGAFVTCVELASMPTERAGAPLAYAVPYHFAVGEKQQKYGLLSHELYVNDDSRVLLEKPGGKALLPLRFDTSGIREK